jgi:hypothetical protein
MKTAISLLFAITAFLPRVTHALTDADHSTLRQLTREYVSWDYSGRPVKFRETLDYESYEEQRGILIQLAERQWNGFWGEYWRRRGVADPKELRAFTPREFWLRYHSGLDPLRSDPETAGSSRISVEIHAITEARGLAYVIYQARHSERRLPKEESFQVLRARKIGDTWRLVAFPRVTAFLRAQLEAAQSKKRPTR